MSGRFTVSPQGPPKTKDPGDVAVVRSWVSLVFYPVSFVAAFALGEGLLSWYGYSDDQSAPAWAVVAAAGPALVVFVVPGVFAVLFGREAMRRGNRGGRLPAIIGASVAVGMIALNVVAAIAAAVT